jgi:hypothetical protein
MSQRAAIWGAAALSLIFALLLSAVLFQPVFGSDGDDSGDGVVTVDSWSEMTGGDGTYDDDDDDRYEDHDDDEHDDDDDD